MAYNYLIAIRKNLDLENIIDVDCFLNRRGVGKDRLKNCKQCNRYGHKDCKLPIPSDDGALKLGYAVIYYVCEEYVHAWRDCEKVKLKSLEFWFKSERPTILSAERYDGVAMLENLQAKCKKEYGDFEERYVIFQTKHKAKLKELQEKLKIAETREERKSLRAKINKEKALLNG